jgi:hypothetical protein
MSVHSLPGIEARPWAERNQRWLSSHLDWLHRRIEQLRAGENPGLVAAPTPAPADDGFVSALERCVGLFGLSRYERDVLMLCAGVALDTGLARAVAEATGNADGAPTFSLAMSVLDEPHWDAMSPQAPLRYWRLVTPGAGHPASAPLRIDERVLHYVTGVAAIDERLESMVSVESASHAMPQEHEWITQVIAALSNGEACVHLEQPGSVVSRDQLDPLLAFVGGTALWVRDLPNDPDTLSGLLRLIDREAALAQALVVLDVRLHDEPGTLLILRVQRQLRSKLIVLGSHAPHPAAPDQHPYRIALPAWTAASQLEALVARAKHYGAVLDDDALRDAMAESCEQFNQSDSGTLDGIARVIAAAGSEPAQIGECSWRALREHSRGGLDAFAQRIDSTTTLDDLILPEAQRNQLLEIGRQVRLRTQVHHEWGFAARTSRGLGLTALFTGESGTGKTMAAEAIANAAGLDLYRIDLASTVSKYIGETEKNLKRIFDAAEHSGAVLLFDEADALFGKRSEVKDSHDRYANIETAYLLQRIEAYRGLGILTTNMRSSLDRAFLRRIRFLVQFPYPDEEARSQLWRRQFPPRAPLADDIGWDALARLHLTGGHIRSVAVNAAFAAAHERSAISHAHLVAAAQAELAKLERTYSPRAGGAA